MFFGTRRSVVDGRILKRLCRQFDSVVLLWILGLAIILGVLNNLRVVDERKVRWFGAPTDSGDFETTTETTQ